MSTVAINLNKRDVHQFMRYVVVGVLNTLVTLAVIYLCKSVLGVNIWVSNALGYIAGMINSFCWNKVWVFRSTSSQVTQVRGEAMRFLVGFLVCYGLQFAATWCLTALFGTFEWTFLWLTISGYGIATLLGMGIYTVANFVYNRVVTFK